MKMNRKLFEQMVFKIASEVLESLPAVFKNNDKEIIFLVADKPAKEDTDNNADDEDTLGLYEGTPLIGRSVNDSDIIPARITIFRLPFLDMCDNIKELKKEVRLTILHELGHHFGFDEKDLEERGLG